jgi:hypothetical protein
MRFLLWFVVCVGVVVAAGGVFVVAIMVRDYRRTGRP